MPYLWTDPDQGAGLTPEVRLLAAVLTQALKDAQSRRPDVRDDALAFLRDPTALDWWSTVLDLTDGVLQRHIRATLGA